MSLHVGKNDADVGPHNPWIAQVQELAGDHDPVPAVLGLHLNIDLKWVRAIKHLSCASACRSSSFENRLQKTVAENFDAAASSLSLTRQRSSRQRTSRQRCLGDSLSALRR